MAIMERTIKIYYSLIHLAVMILLFFMLSITGGLIWYLFFYFLASASRMLFELVFDID